LRFQVVKIFIFLSLVLASLFKCKVDTPGQVNTSNVGASDSVEKQNLLIVPDFRSFTNSSCEYGGIEIRNQNSLSKFSFWSTCQKSRGIENKVETTIEAYFSNRISSLPTLNNPDLSKYFCINSSVAIYNFFSNKNSLISPHDEQNSAESNCRNFFSKRYRSQSLIFEISNETNVAPLKNIPTLNTLDLHGDSALAEVEGLHHLTQLETLHLKSIRFNFAELLNLKNLKSLHIDDIDINLALRDWGKLRSQQGLNFYSGNISELSIKNSILSESALVSIASVQSLYSLELVNNQLNNIAILATMKNLTALRLNRNPQANLIDMIEIINSTDLSTLYFDNEARKLTSHPLLFR
jgi:hypothetical protein